MRKIGIAQAEVDATKIIEDTEDFLVVPAVIAREGVFKYPDGMAFKPKEELAKYAWTFDGVWTIPNKHPDTVILTDPDIINGRVEKPFFCDKINGIRANIRFDKKRNKPDFVAAIKNGTSKDVSIGFFFDQDPMPGEWNGQHYDYVQRRYLGNHLATGVPVGRCSSPYCGIAIDELIRKPAGDPWEETEDYIRSGHREPSETCRTDVLSEEKGIKAIICKYGDKWEIQSYLFSKAKDWTVEKAKAWFTEHKQTADANVLSAKDIEVRILDLGKQRKDLMTKLYPHVEEETPERSKMHLAVSVIDEQINTLTKQLAFKADSLEVDQKATDATAPTHADPILEIERSRRLLES